MWDLPARGLEPVSSALAGGFLTTAPPGKSPIFYYLNPTFNTAVNLVEVSIAIVNQLFPLILHFPDSSF